MTGLLTIICVYAVLYVLPVAGVSLTFSESKVIKGPGDIVLTCGVDETSIGSVLVLQVKMFLGKEWIQLGQVQSGRNVTNTVPAGLADRMRISGSIDVNEPRNTQLILTINKDKILCTDGTLYQCYLAYSTSSVTNPEIKTDSTNGTLEVYVYPSVMSLRGKKNGDDVEGSTVVNQARFKVGDELELICDANIGSIPNVDIQWKRTSEISSEDMWLDYSPPPGTSSQTAAIHEDCKYTRTGRIMYNMTSADANRKSNLGFLCFVRVTGSPYNQYETTENPKFYAEVGGGNSGTQEAVASAGAGGVGGGNVGAIVGGVIGGLVAIIIIVVVVWFLWFRPRGGESYRTKEDRPNYPNQAPPVEEYTVDKSKRRGHENRGLDEPHETRKKDREHERNGRGRANYGMDKDYDNDDDDYNSRDGSPTMTHHGINPSDGSFGTGV